jgi:GNAT superfamily N-acetyltransferase
MQQTGRFSFDLIRPGKKPEMAAIASVVKAALAEFSDRIPPKIFRAYVEESSNLADRWDDADVLVAEVDGEVAGTVTFYADAGREGMGLPHDWAGFRTLAVHPAARGRRIGRALMQACLEKARDRGAPTLGIHTAAVMNAACRLYEQAGFRRCAEYDVWASEVLDLGAGAGDVAVIAYRLDLATP